MPGIPPAGLELMIPEKPVSALVNAAETTAVCEVTEVVDGGRQAEDCMAMAERGERGGCSALGASAQGDLSQLSIAALNGEPTLKDVFLAIQNCKHTLNTLSTQFNCLREDVTIMHLDMQKVRECTSALEKQVATIGKVLGCMQHELKAVGILRITLIV